jgi:Flp pilus assembly protein TadG
VRRGRHSGIPKTRKQNGQALVEVACTLPLLALILMGCLDLGRAFHVHMAAANAAHVGLMYAQQVTDPTTSDPNPLTIADVITKTVTAAQGSIPITLANADSYVKVYVDGASAPISRDKWNTKLSGNQDITVTVTDPFFKAITPFVQRTNVGGSASGRTLP